MSRFFSGFRYSWEILGLLIFGCCSNVFLELKVLGQQIVTNINVLRTLVDTVYVFRQSAIYIVAASDQSLVLLFFIAIPGVV